MAPIDTHQRLILLGLLPVRITLQNWYLEHATVSIIKSKVNYIQISIDDR
jgi:hypothetical protein